MLDKKKVDLRILATDAQTNGVIGFLRMRKIDFTVRVQQPHPALEKELMTVRAAEAALAAGMRGWRSQHPTGQTVATIGDQCIPSSTPFHLHADWSWWFWNSEGSDEFGPFATAEECRLACAEYRKGL